MVLDFHTYLDINTVWVEALSTLYAAYDVAIFPFA